MFYTIFELFFVLIVFLIFCGIIGTIVGFIAGGIGATCRWIHDKTSDWE